MFIATFASLSFDPDTARYAAIQGFLRQTPLLLPHHPEAAT